MQGLIEAEYRHTPAVGMHINAPKTKVMSALISDEQRKTVLQVKVPQFGVHRKQPGR